MNDRSAFNCETCEHKHCDKDRTMPDSNGPAPGPKWEIPGVGEFDTCLLPVISEQSAFYINAYPDYQYRLFLVDGGRFNQPNCYLQAIQVIQNYVNHLRKQHELYRQN